MADTEELEKIDLKGTKVIIPSQKQAFHNPGEKLFSKDNFVYDKECDCYYCPEGHELVREGRQEGYKKIEYRVKDASTCKQCLNYGEYTKAQKGRKVARLLLEEVKEKFEWRYEQPESQEIYKQRKVRVEHPFGHIERNFEMTNFLLRGREGVQAEPSIAAICFNIVRMITLFGGAKGFIGRLCTV